MGSAILHAAFIAYGLWQDKVGIKVEYTDVDYWVMSDAAELMAEGKSPFDRPTFRYSPLLALLLLPNGVFGKVYGKVLYSMFDIVASWVIYGLLKRQGVARPSAALYTALFHTCNPLVVAVSTRGNAESIVCTLCLLFIWLLSKRRRAMAAVCLGLAIHVKLFPALFVPTVLVFMGIFPDSNYKNAQRLANTTETPVKSFVSSIPGTPIEQAAPVKSNPIVASPSKTKYQFLFTVSFKWKHFQFLLLTGATFVLCNVFTLLLYGKKGLYESLVHHLVRRDHRHNFSPYWLMYYHSATLNLPRWAVSILPFLSQAALSLMISYKYGKRDFCFACFLQTFLFVSLNKVCTSQVPYAVLLNNVVFSVVHLPAASMPPFIEGGQMGRMDDDWCTVDRWSGKCPLVLTQHSHCFFHRHTNWSSMESLCLSRYGWPA